MDPKDISTLYQHAWSDSDSGKTDGTVYFTPDEALDFRHRLAIQVVDTPGVAGTNTYTLEATLDGSNWADVTNDLLGAASFTAGFLKAPTSPVPVDQIRIKRVRSGDAGNNDGGSAVYVKYSYP